ncbi:MAG: DUF6364 family protein [Chloroflexota bacterium]
MATAHEKVTLSLPKDLVVFADAEAAQQGTNRSRIVAELLAQERQRRRDALAAEGYQFYSSEAREWAGLTQTAVAEAVTREREAW